MESGIELEIDIRPPGLTFMADTDQLEQVLINLLRNACQALDGYEAPRIKLAASLGSEERPLLTVTDDGPGVPAEHRDRVFVPFYSTRRAGSGVGLALSRQVMIGHGGHITVTDAPRGGAEFRLRF